jgi:hypothetical protein
MPRVERAKNPSIEQIQQAQAQHRLVMETPQIPPFDQGNLNQLTDHLEKLASLENRRQKAHQKSKLAVDADEKAQIQAAEADFRAKQKKLAQSEAARLLRQFEKIRWGRILAGGLAQGVVISLFFSLLDIALIHGVWHWSPLALVTPPLFWFILMWSNAPPVLTSAPSPKRARKLARALGRRMETAGLYSLVARPWLTAVVLWKMPRQIWQARKSGKAQKK